MVVSLLNRWKSEVPVLLGDADLVFMQPNQSLYELFMYKSFSYQKASYGFSLMTSEAEVLLADGRRVR